MRPTALSVHSACVAPCRNTSLLLLLVTDANACCDVNMYPNKGLDSQFDNTHRRHCRSKTLFGTSPRPPRVILVQPQARIVVVKYAECPLPTGGPCESLTGHFCQSPAWIGKAKCAEMHQAKRRTKPGMDGGTSYMHGLVKSSFCA